MVGRTLRHYEVETLLGKGGMGEVYRARDTRLDRPIALKVLPANLTDDVDRRRRFQQEARTASSVNHPAIAQIYEADEIDGVTYIAMEFVEGRTLRNLIAAREIDLLGALTIAIPIGEGLSKAHAAGVIHRDIKAENIMVTPDGHAKLLDFGLAKQLPLSDSDGDNPSMLETLAHSEAKTRAGVVLGTVSYMSPEQARGQSVDHHSDIFSFGVVLYEMVTGQLPFTGTTPLDTMHAIAFEETRPITQLRTNLPPSLHRVVARCLRKRPEDRYEGADQLVDDLRAVQQEIETGISRSVPLADRIRDQIQSLKDLTPAEMAWPMAIGGVLLALVVLLLVRGDDSIGSLIVLGLIVLFTWRRLRNRPRRLLGQFARRVGKLPEVRVVAVRDTQVTVLVDRAVANTYIRVNAWLDQANAKMFFGEPLSVSVRDDLGPEELRELLRGTGVVYVREDVTGADTTAPPS